MNNLDIFAATGSIDEKWLSEAENYTPKEKKKKTGLLISVAACIALILTVVISGSKFFKTPIKPQAGTTLPAMTYDNSDNLQQTTASVTEEMTDAPATTENIHEETDITDAFEITTGVTQNYASEGGNLWIDPKDFTGSHVAITVTGEKISDEEALKYLEENRNSIISGLSESGENISASNAHFSPKGYSHILFPEYGAETFEIRENFRDYLLYNGDNLISIITIYKENGIMYSTPAFGGHWFSAYAKFLEEHKGEELLFIYAGTAELILTPDNYIYGPVLSEHNTDLSAYFSGIENPYDKLYHPSAVYIP